MAANETQFPYECNIDICPIEASFYEYRPSIALNAIPLAIFAASFLVFAVQCVRYRTWTFWIAMGFGNVAEILGYVGRLLSWRDPFEMNPFLIQIICLTLAPAFFAAGIYLSLSRIVIIFGPHLSRIKPKNYTRLFVACDIISLVLQGAGGGIASVDSQAYRSPQKGTNIMVAGLAFQVFTLALFISLCVEFGIRVYRAPPESYATRFATLRGSRRFKAFLGVLLLATLCIETRSIFRLIEMAEGWEGELMKNETLFFVLEGVMVMVAVVALNVVHPGVGMREAYHVEEEREKVLGDSEAGSGVSLEQK